MNGLAKLDSLAVQINEAHAAAERDAHSALAQARKAGDLLHQAKGELPHGEWGTWLRNNCSVSERQAQKYMRVATHWPEIKDKAESLRAALEVLADPKGDPNPTRGADLKRPKSNAPAQRRRSKPKLKVVPDHGPRTNDEPEALTGELLPAGNRPEPAPDQSPGPMWAVEPTASMRDVIDLILDQGSDPDKQADAGAWADFVSRLLDWIEDNVDDADECLARVRRHAGKEVATS